MTNRIILASAGAGKTHRIVDDAIHKIAQGSNVLLITYTQNNQSELIKKFKELEGRNKSKFHVKGLFTFLLEDIIRPYQRYIFGKRIENINFNKSDPHRSNGKRIPGRNKMRKDGSYNSIYYLTVSKKKAHTTYLSDLATQIIKESGGKPIARLEAIYDDVYIDEVQDLVGWDYKVLEEIAKSNKLNITCVGDFRQTIYDSAITTKRPKNSQQKLEWFKGMKFEPESMSISRRSIQSICDLADEIHANEGYEKTKSLVKSIPDELEHREHTGVFVVKKSDAIRYTKKYKPTLLRNNAISGKEFRKINVKKITFGKSKGLGFDRVLILPTEPYRKYLFGDKGIFDSNKTDKSKNKLYVAMTRARYSLGFVIPDELAKKCNLPIWEEDFQTVLFW